MYTHEQGWKMTETEKVVHIIREVGVAGLGNFDGCCCCQFSIRNVDVEISCGKGHPRGVRVYSFSCDYMDEKDLHPIMDEVVSQLDELAGYRGPFPRHFGPADRTKP